MEKVPGQQRVTVAGDKGYDTRDIVAEFRNLAATASVSKLKDLSEALQLEHSRNVAVFFSCL